MYSPSPGSSDFDVNFRLFGFPVQVTPWFWLSAVFLGLPQAQRSGDWLPLATWVGVVFISLLVHELGHAFAGRALGHRPFIVLTFMGGAAYSGQEFGWRQVFVTAAGPAAGFALFLLCHFLWFNGYLPTSVTVQQFWMVNLFWTIFNLLPVYPLDGGQMMQGATQALVPRWSIVVTHSVSAVVAALVAIYGMTSGAPFLMVFFAMFCLLNIQILQGNR